MVAQLLAFADLLRAELPSCSLRTSILKVSKEVDYPHETVSVQSTTGSLVEVARPFGFFCTLCDSGTSAGLPYFEDKAELKEAIQESDTLRKLCLDVVEAYHANGGDVGRAPSDEEVRSIENVKEEIRCVYTAFEHDKFTSKHMGCTPEDLEVDAVHCEHPLTMQPLQLYPTEPDDHFQIVVTAEIGAQRSVDKFPQRVYPEQGQHTMQYLKSHLGSKLGRVRLPPQRPAMLQRMKELAAKRNQQNRGGVVKTEGGAPSLSSTLPAAIFAAQQPQSRPTFIPGPRSRPALPARAASGAQVVQRCLPVPTCAKSAPAAPSGAAAGPASTGPLAASVRLVRAPPPIAKSEVGEVKVEAAPQPKQSTTIKRAASGSPSDTPFSKRTVQQVHKSTPTAGPSPGGFTLKGLGVADVVDLSKIHSGAPVAQKGSERATSTNKFEKTCVPLDIPRVLGGVNIESDLSNARRMLGFAKRESPEDWEPKVAKAIDLAEGAKELLMPKIMVRTTLDPVRKLATIVQEACPDRRLPKGTFADLSFADAASHHLKPWKASSDLYALLQALKIKGGTVVTYSVDAPSIFADFIEAADRQSGIVAERWVSFWEKYVLPPQLKLGPPNRPSLAQFVDEGLLDYLDSLGPEFDNDIFNGFKNRLLGLVWVIGVTPFVHDSSAVHVNALTTDQSNPLRLAVNGNIWSNNLLDQAFLWYAGEKSAWPRAKSAVDKVLGEDHAESVKAIDEVVASYSVWSAQCRPPSLPAYVHRPVLEFLGKHLDAKAAAAPAEGPSFDPSDAQVKWVLNTARSLKKLGWRHDALDDIMTRLVPVATVLQKQNAESAVVSACAIGSIDDLQDESKLLSFVESLAKVLPEKGSSSVYIGGDSRRLVLTVLAAFVAQLLLRYPADKRFYDLAVALLERVVFDLENPIEGFDVVAQAGAVKDGAFVFRRLRGYENHVHQIESANVLTEEATESKANQAMVQKLVLYNTYFTEDSKFQAFTLPESTKAKFHTLRGKGETVISQFKVIYFGNALKVANAKREAVRQMKGGGPDGASWRDSIVDGCSWDEFLAATASNLRTVNRVDAICAIRDCDEARPEADSSERLASHPV